MRNPTPRNDQSQSFLARPDQPMCKSISAAILRKGDQTGCQHATLPPLEDHDPVRHAQSSIQFPQSLTAWWGCVASVPTSVHTDRQWEQGCAVSVAANRLRGLIQHVNDSEDSHLKLCRASIKRGNLKGKKSWKNVGLKSVRCAECCPAAQTHFLAVLLTRRFHIWSKVGRWIASHRGQWAAVHALVRSELSQGSA